MTSNTPLKNEQSGPGWPGWDFWIKAPENGKYRWISWLILGLLFLLGVGWWGAFYNWGRFPMDFQDWIAVTAPRFFFLRDAAIHLALPLHVTDPSLLGWVTTRYMSLPDAFLSPQAFLLRYLSVERWIFFDILGMYLLGFLGLLWLRRRLKLSLAAFTVVFLLFNFNGHIVAHLSIGHETWGGYFLFPWFVVLALDLLDGERGWGWVAKVAGLLFITLLQGSYHQFIWELFFLGFLSIAKKGLFVPALKAAVAAVMLAAVRLLPVTLEAGAFDSNYHGGYLGLADVWKGFTGLQAPDQYLSSPLFLKDLGGWEFTIYVGLAGALFLGFFGIYRWWSAAGDTPNYHALILPVLGMAVISMNGVFGALRSVPFPMLSGERVPARILSLPFVFVLVMAAFYFQRWLDRDGTSRALRLAVAGGTVAFALHDLWENLSIWNVKRVQGMFDHEIMIYNKWVVANDYNDQAYIQMLIIGAVVSGIVLAVLLGLAWRERRVSRAPAIAD
jgi:hypothetical protein